jgi:periplasmic mercuric ion binding protein
MKATKFLAAGMLIVFFMAGIRYVNAGPSPKSETLKMKVEMSCANCQAKIEKGLNGAEGVKKAVADLETKTVTITYNPEKTNKEKLVKVVEDLGYRTEFTAKDAKVGHDCTKESGEKKDCSKTCTGDKK